LGQADLLLAMQHTGLAFLKVKPTVEAPVFAVDTLHVECEVIEARLLKSRPSRDEALQG